MSYMCDSLRELPRNYGETGKPVNPHNSLTQCYILFGRSLPQSATAESRVRAHWSNKFTVSESLVHGKIDLVVFPTKNLVFRPTNTYVS